MSIVVKFEGLAQLQRSLRDIEPRLLTEFRKELRSAAVPVARQAHTLAQQNIPTVTEPWSEFRVGATANLVYVAPRQRGVKGGGTRKRPKFGSLLNKRALEPSVPLAERELECHAETALHNVIVKAGL